MWLRLFKVWRRKTSVHVGVMMGGTLWNFRPGPPINISCLYSCDYLRLFNLLLSTFLLWVCFLRACVCVSFGVVDGSQRNMGTYIMELPVMQDLRKLSFLILIFHLFVKSEIFLQRFLWIRYDHV